MIFWRNQADGEGFDSDRAERLCVAGPAGRCPELPPGGPQDPSVCAGADDAADGAGPDHGPGPGRPAGPGRHQPEKAADAGAGAGRRQRPEDAQRVRTDHGSPPGHEGRGRGHAILSAHDGPAGGGGTDPGGPERAAGERDHPGGDGRIRRAGRDSRCREGETAGPEPGAGRL